MPDQAVLFDLDGTLVDSLADIGESMNFVLAEKGLPEHSLGDYRAFVGDGMKMLARRALPPGERTGEAIEACVARMIEVYAGRVALKTRPYDGIAELLDELVARGIAAAVLSNKPHGPTVDLVARLFPRRPFAVVFGERRGVPRKPDPAAAVEIASKLALAPAAVLYVGDTPTDMATAISAGMRPLGAGWGFRSEAELRAAGAPAVASHPREVLAHLL
jgi:phosphoglycolate phosphatase